MLIDFKDRTAKDRYQLMVNTIIPRPIAWIMTQGKVLNIAPFSYFTPISSTPPTIIVSIGHRADGTPKDTLKNLRDNKKCVVCIIDDEHFNNMHLSSKGLDPDISEVEFFDIETQKVLEEFPPMPKRAKIAIFGEYLQEVDLKGSPTIPVIIKIKHLYIDDKIISNRDKISLEFDVIARVGQGYRKLGEELTTPDIP